MGISHSKRAEDRGKQILDMVVLGDCDVLK
jgi:hypothetical protein